MGHDVFTLSHNNTVDFFCADYCVSNSVISTVCVTLNFTLASFGSVNNPRVFFFSISSCESWVNGSHRNLSKLGSVGSEGVAAWERVGIPTEA